VRAEATLAPSDQAGNQGSVKAVQFDFETMGALERYKLLLATVCRDRSRG